MWVSSFICLILKRDLTGLRTWDDTHLSKIYTNTSPPLSHHPSPQLGACHACQLVLVANYTAIMPIFTHLSCNYMNITEAIIELCSLHNGVF